LDQVEKLDLPSDHPVDQLEGDPHDIFGCIANVDLLKRDLSWESKVALDQGIDKMLVWAKEKFGNDFSKL
jgi:nucleoside-diphosphate-sugar epimerase